MSTKHTPGPWIAESALTGGQIPVGPHPLHRVAMVNGRAGEQEANAALIAAAPDLLEALRMAEERLGSHPLDENDNYDVLPVIRAAISKAEGRS